MSTVEEIAEKAIAVLNRNANLTDEIKETVIHKSNPDDVFHFDRRSAIGNEPIYYQDINAIKTYNNEAVIVTRTLTNLSLVRNTYLATLTSEAHFPDSSVMTSGDTSFFKSSYTSTSPNPAFVSTITNVRHLVPIDNVSPDYTPGYSIIQTGYASILDLNVVSNSIDYVVTGFKPIIYVNKDYVNRVSIIVELKRTNTNGYFTVKDNEGKDLEVYCKNTWFNGSVHTFSLTVTGKAVIVAGAENLTSMSSQDLVTQSNLGELQGAIALLKLDVSQMQKMVDSINATVNSIIANEKGAELSSILQDLKDGGLSNSSVVRIFSLLCEFGSKIGVPYVKTFSTVVNTIYRVLTDNSVDSNSRFSSSGTPPAIFQSLNSLPLDIILGSAEIGVSNLNTSLTTVYNLIATGEHKYCTASIIGTDAFGFSDIISAIKTTYGSTAIKVKELIDRYPLHIYLLIKEHDPLVPDSPSSRVLRVDAGMDIKKKIGTGDFAMLPYNFDYLSYTLDSVPDDVVNRDMSRVVMPLGSSICAFTFDKIVELAAIFKKYSPKYDALTFNCQDISMSFHHTIVNGEIGYVSYLLTQ